MKVVTLSHSYLFAILALMPVFAPSSASCETLHDVLGSRPMHNVELATERARKQRGQVGREDVSWFNGMDPQSNFALIWGSNGGVGQLFNWVGAILPQYKLVNTHTKRAREFARADGFLMNRERVQVRLDILVPHPTYRSMVSYKTLSDFNAFEPPTLRIVAEESMEVNKHPAKYYRSERGFCSILVKVDPLTVVNLSVSRCENSNVMMDVANKLDYARLEKKLNS